MNCTACNASLPDDAAFCMACGVRQAGSASLSLSSSGGHIRRLVPPEYLDRLMSASRSVSGSRRLVTMLFFDVTGSTSMFEGRDPEDVMEIMNEAFAALMPPVYRYEGTLARLMGDGVLAFFGAPVSHVDDAARACAAALEIRDASRRFAASLEARRGIGGFDVRIGLNTGLVVVGEVGDDHRVEYTAMGDAVNVAARLESSAAPGTVLVSGDTRALVTTGFEFESVGNLALKGRADAVPAWRLLGRSSIAEEHSDPGIDWEVLAAAWDEDGGAEIPADARALLQAHIDGLPAASRRVLLTASVINAPFGRALLEQSLRFDAQDWVLDHALDPLLVAGFLEAGDSGDAAQYQITYPIVREVAYGSLLKSHRKLLHRRVEQAIQVLDRNSGREA